MKDLYAQLAGREPPSTVRKTAYVDGGKKKNGTSSWDREARGYKSAYKAQREANKRAMAAAQEQARQTAAAQIDALDREYRQTNRQLYRDYMQQQRALPEQLAAQGYSGGLTESSRLRLGTAYGEALNTNEQARLGRAAGYDQALSQQLYEARAARAAADSKAQQDYYAQRSRLEERRRAQERADLEKRAAALGAKGDFRLYRKLGYTDREIRYLERMYRKQHPELFKKG